MITPINSLMNMEYALYGGASAWNPACPSYTNGYQANQNFYNLYNPYGYNYNTGFYGLSNTPKTSTQSQTTSSVASKGGVSKADLDTLGEYYLKNAEPSESILGAAAGGAAFGAVNNMRFIAHPWNSISTIRGVDKMFAGIKDKNSNIYKLWNNGETRQLVMDAYGRMHKLEGGSKWRAGLFKARIKPDEQLYQELKREMESAIASGDKEALAKATEKIRIATNAKTGFIPRMWEKAKTSFGAKPSTTVAQKLANDGAIKAAVTKNIAEKSRHTLAQHLGHEFKSLGGKGGIFMLGLEFVMSFGKIKAAFSKDKETGMKQLGQTTVKGVGTLVGWSAGQAVGAWAGAKLGAAVGTAVAPGIGTAIGAIAGLVGGSIGCALMGKLTKKLVGEDVGSKVEVEEMKKTPEGQAKLLELTAQQALDDKKADPKVLEVLKKLSA